MTDTEQERIKAICKVAHINDISNLSDGYHTFKQLYYQRMMLFAVIVKQNRDKAWKSLRHEDGELCFGGGWFIVGIDTPKGSYTYHYEDNYFSLFDCEELERGKKWDGHTEKDVTRLLSLEQEPCEELDFVQPHKKMSVNLNIEEPCEDCVSRQAVAEVLLKYAHSAEGKAFAEFLISQINALPPRHPCGKGGRWIPVSERLPEKEMNCLVTDSLGKVHTVTFNQALDGRESYFSGCYCVRAWMPLPKPYKAESEE